MEPVRATRAVTPSGPARSTAPRTASAGAPGASVGVRWPGTRARRRVALGQRRRPGPLGHLPAGTSVSSSPHTSSTGQRDGGQRVVVALGQQPDEDLAHHALGRPVVGRAVALPGPPPSGPRRPGRAGGGAGPAGSRRAADGRRPARGTSGAPVSTSARTRSGRAAARRTATRPPKEWPRTHDRPGRDAGAPRAGGDQGLGVLGSSPRARAAAASPRSRGGRGPRPSSGPRRAVGPAGHRREVGVGPPPAVEGEHRGPGPPPRPRRTGPTGERPQHRHHDRLRRSRGADRGRIGPSATSGGATTAIRSGRLGRQRARPVPPARADVCVRPGLTDGPRQRRAVGSPTPRSVSSPGPGSGKTTVLTRRVARRVLDGSADADHTAGGAPSPARRPQELRERLRAYGVPVSTPPGPARVHGPGVRRHLPPAGADPPAPPTRWTPASPRRCSPSPAGELVAELGGRSGASRARRVDDRDRRGPRPAASGPGPTPRPRGAAADRWSAGAAADQVAEALRRATRRRRPGGASLDLDDLLVRCGRPAPRGRRASPSAVRWRIRHLFVDEFQDVNPAQFRLLRALLGDQRDLFVVGRPPPGRLRVERRRPDAPRPAPRRSCRRHGGRPTRRQPPVHAPRWWRRPPRPSGPTSTARARSAAGRRPRPVVDRLRRRRRRGRSGGCGPASHRCRPRRPSPGRTHGRPGPDPRPAGQRWPRALGPGPASPTAWPRVPSSARSGRPSRRGQTLRR